VNRLTTFASYLLLAVALLLAVGFVATLIGARRIEAAFPPEGKFVDVKGGRLHYVERAATTPDAPTLLMLHGASGNHAELPLALGAALDGRYRIISIDRPGHGWSDRIDGRAASSPARQAALIAEGLRTIGAPRVIVVAHSLAGAAALQFALNHPDQTASLVLIGAVSHPWPGGIAWYYGPASQPLIGPLFAHTLALPLGTVAMTAGVAGVFAPQRVPDNYIVNAKIPLVLRPSNFQANAQDVSVLKAFVTGQYPRYAGIAAPVAIVAGDRDDTVTTDVHSRALAKQIPHAELTVLPGVGHAPHHFAPDVVVAAIDSVAAKIGRAFALR
jgi:pimeloyl-ACP methyl ester carboxylesterase